MSWIPLEFDTDVAGMYGVFDAHGYDFEPLALFSDEDDAHRWVRFMTSEVEEDYRLGIEVCVTAVRHVQGEGWNSYEKPEWHAEAAE